VLAYGVDISSLLVIEFETLDYAGCECCGKS